MDLDRRNKVFIKSPLPDYLNDWATLMNIRLVSSQQREKYELVYENQRLELHWFDDRKFLPLYSDSPKKQRITSANLLIRAIGKNTRVVHDLTAGLGTDAMTLAAFGKEINCVERCAPIALLFYDGLRRSPIKISSKIKINFADSLQWLQNKETDVQTIYIDAMFAHKKKSAKSTKSMQILRSLAGDDDDAALLFNQALASGAKRIVVKQPDNAPTLMRKPTAQFQGKTIRFDVYIVN